MSRNQLLIRKTLPGHRPSNFGCPRASIRELQHVNHSRPGESGLRRNCPGGWAARFGSRKDVRFLNDAFPYLLYYLSTPLLVL